MNRMTSHTLLLFLLSIITVFTPSSASDGLKNCLENGFSPGSVPCSSCDILHEELNTETDAALGIVSDCKKCCSITLDLHLPIRYRTIKFSYSVLRSIDEFGGVREWMQDRLPNYSSIEVHQSYTNGNPVLELTNPYYDIGRSEFTADKVKLPKGSLDTLVVDISSWKVDEIDQFLKRKSSSK